MSDEAARARLDDYLAQVRRELRGLPPSEQAEIAAELRSHVLDRVQGELTVERVETAITALGAPRLVAQANLTERMVARVEADRSPWSVMAAAGRLAGVSAYGLVALLGSLTGYGVAAAWFATALVKLFMPDHAGLWVGPHSFALGVVSGQTAGRELLGWEVVPLGLTLGVAFTLLTWRFGLFSVRLMGRRA